MSFLSFRITHPDFAIDPLYKKNEHHPEVCERLTIYYIDNVKNYLKSLGYDIVEYVAGIHLEAEAPHLHLHFVVDTGDSHIHRSYIQHWKYTYSSQKLAQVLPWCDFKYPCLFSYKHKSKINISIKFTKEPIKEEDDLQISKYLGYPLKEGIYVDSDIDGTRMERLSAQAQGIWNAVKIKKLRDKQREHSTATEYGKICEIISSSKPDSYEDAVRIVLEELKKTRTEQKEHVNPQFVIKSVQKFCYHTDIWSIDEIMAKYA